MSKGFKPGNKERPPTAGRKAGGKNKLGPTALDLIETLRVRGHNAAAAQLEVYILAIKQYKKIISSGSSFGAASFLAIAEKANSELLKYIYPQRKAIEGADGAALTVKAVIEWLDQDESGK